MPHYQNIKENIIAGIIVAILVSMFIQPILNYIVEFLIFLGDIFYKELSNKFYKEAAKGLREKHSFITLFLYISTYISFGFSYLLIQIILKPKNQKININKLKYINPFFIVIFIIFIIESMIFLSIHHASFNMNSSYIQSMRIIRPLIDDKTYYQIDSEWASMENRKEYDKINEKIKKIAKIHNVKLPKPLWKL